MNDKRINDLPFVAFHGIQKLCHKPLQMASPFVAKKEEEKKKEKKKGEATQKYNHWIELISLELPAGS